MVVVGSVRRGLQLSRRAAASGLIPRQRAVGAEILDELPPTDARAIRSRRDLRRVNFVMGSCGILSRTLRDALASSAHRAPLRILELGAGDGSLALRLAGRLSRSRPEAELTLLDRQALLAEPTGIAFAHLGWTLRALTVDVFEWARSPTQQRLTDRWDVILANLFLHHFETDALRELLAAVADRCDAFIACEPRRSLTALIGSRLLPALGVSRDTLHDAVVSVRAGFRGDELSRMWPGRPRGWKVAERPAGLFSHLFVAARADAA
jgi:2-polyprenyl-3-methyl-5-hydroxy-6-metoxy-1,4-benzoquinol methylase